MVTVGQIIKKTRLNVGYKNTRSVSIQALRFSDKTVDLVHTVQRRLGPPFFLDYAFSFFPQGLDVFRVRGEIEEHVSKCLTDER